MNNVAKMTLGEIKSWSFSKVINILIINVGRTIFNRQPTHKSDNCSTWRHNQEAKIHRGALGSSDRRRNLGPTCPKCGCCGESRGPDSQSERSLKGWSWTWIKLNKAQKKFFSGLVRSRLTTKLPVCSPRPSSGRAPEVAEVASRVKTSLGCHTHTQCSDGFSQ